MNSDGYVNICMQMDTSTYICKMELVKDEPYVLVNNYSHGQDTYQKTKSNIFDNYDQ